MIEFLLSLPTWVGCAVMMGFTAVAGFVVYLVFHKLISKYQREDMHEPFLVDSLNWAVLGVKLMD